MNPTRFQTKMKQQPKHNHQEKEQCYVSIYLSLMAGYAIGRGGAGGGDDVTSAAPFTVTYFSFTLRIAAHTKVQ